MRGLRSFGVVALVAVSTGCNSQKTEQTLVSKMSANGYEFEYELSSPSSIQMKSRDVHVSTGKAQIDVVEGTLRVNGQSYGAVKQKDRISVIGDNVSVNDEVRTKGD